MQQSYPWSTHSSAGLVVSVGTMLVSGVLLLFLPVSDSVRDALRTACTLGLAGMGLCALIAAQCAAAHAQAGWEARRMLSLFLPGLALCLGLAGTSMVGVHLGWQVLTLGAPETLPSEAQITAASLFLALSKPAMSWLLAARVAVDRERERRDDRETVDLAREREQRALEAEERRRALRVAGVAGAAGLALAGGGIAVSEVAAPAETLDGRLDPRETPWDARPVIVDGQALAPRDAERFREVAMALREGLAPSQIIAATGVPRSTCYRWIQEIRRTPMLGMAA